MAATAQPRTGRTHRPPRPNLTRTGMAYDAGRNGEAAPAWLGDDPKLEDAYERGVSDREAAEAGAPPRDPEDQPATAASPPAPVKATRAASGRTGTRASVGRGNQARTKRPPSTSAGRRRTSVPQVPVGRPTLRPPSRLSVSDGSGFMLGLVLYALGLNYLRYGWPGVTGWVKAKFINHPMDTSVPPDLAGKSPRQLYENPLGQPPLLAPAPKPTPRQLYENPYGGTGLPQ